VSEKVGEASADDERARARSALESVDADVALLSSLGNVTYASGWEVPVPFGALAELAYGAPLLLLGVRETIAILIVPDAYAAAASAAASVDEVVSFETFDGFRATDSRGGFLGAIQDAWRRAGGTGGAGTLAIEGRTLPQAVAALLASDLARWTLVDAEGPLQQARSIKTAREIGLLRRAARVGDVAQRALGELSREVGRTEYAMWAEISRRIYEAAGRDIPLSGELVSGPRTTAVAYPNGPRERTTEPGDAVLMDLSGRIDGYWFDVTNTYVVGGVEPTADQVRYAKASQAACEAAMAALWPGARAADAAAAAEAAFAGYALPMAHYAGHQIGVTVNELPRLVSYDSTPIEAGMVFSVEPGAYQGAGGSFGARSEKMVLVTPAGPEILSSFAWGI